MTQNCILQFPTPHYTKSAGENCFWVSLRMHLHWNKGFTDCCYIKVFPWVKWQHKTSKPLFTLLVAFHTFQHPVILINMLIQLSGIWCRSSWNSKDLWQWFGICNAVYYKIRPMTTICWNALMIATVYDLPVLNRIYSSLL
jgi:hypothetical protein